MSHQLIKEATFFSKQYYDNMKDNLNYLDLPKLINCYEIAGMCLSEFEGIYYDSTITVKFRRLYDGFIDVILKKKLTKEDYEKLKYVFDNKVLSYTEELITIETTIQKFLKHDINISEKDYIKEKELQYPKKICIFAVDARIV